MKGSVTASKKNKKKTGRTRKWAIRLICLVLLVTGLLIFLSEETSLDTGLAYLNAQSKADISEVESQLEETKLQAMSTKIASGEISVFAAFSDSVLMGDSRVVGFASWGYVPSGQVLAAAGDTIMNISDHLETIETMQPKYIFSAFGVNDMGLQIGSEYGENGYRQVYEEQLDAVLEVSPNSILVINSIIDPTPEAIEKAPLWSQVDDFNRQIQAMCEDRGWIYVDNSALSKGGLADIYDIDGIHFQGEFYPVWAGNMLQTSMPALFSF